MKVNKKVIGNLEKCYSIEPLKYNDKEYFLIAAEKHDECQLFDLFCNKVDTLWEEPGGVMTMVQVPNSNGVFMATNKFYSPNDSKEAKLVLVSPKNGGWEIKTLIDLPFVHRFDIIRDGEKYYIVACTLKSNHEYKDDWRFPGKVFTCELPSDLSKFDENNQLEFTVIKDNLLKNHGYCKVIENGVEKCLISTNEGVFLFTPNGSFDSWKIEQLVDTPSSDAVLVDLDGNGVKELVLIENFHGNTVRIYKNIDGKYKEVYKRDNVDFAHSIYGGSFNSKEVAIIGHRKGARDLLMFTYDKNSESYLVDYIDHNCGSTNVEVINIEGKDTLISTNREINEIAMYDIEF